MKKIILVAFFAFSLLPNCFAGQEIISGAEARDTVVLNEELRKHSADIANNESTIDDHEQRIDAIEATSGYQIFVTGGVNTPLDATSYYAGTFTGVTGITNADTMRFYFPKAGTIKSARLAFTAPGAGSNETSSIYIRLNNTTDTLITNQVENSTNPTFYSNDSLSIAVTASDYFELKWTTPTWVTNPSTVRIGCIIWVET